MLLSHGSTYSVYVWNNTYLYLNMHINFVYSDKKWKLLKCSLTIVRISFPVALMKYLAKRNLWQKAFIWLKIPGYSPSLMWSKGSRHLKIIGCVTSTVKSREQWVNTCTLVLSFPSLFLDNSNSPAYGMLPPTVCTSSHFN